MMLSVKNGCFSYPKGPRILSNINFALSDGQVMAVLGPNGAGKTTLLRCMMGFLKWSSGQSLIDGREISKLSSRELWRILAYVPQARSSRGSYTAEEMVLLGRSSRIGVFSQPGSSDIDAAHSAMERLGILHLKDKAMDKMSGGEAQMVLIARALASEPRILILDEPESNLDFKNQLLVLDAMSSLADEGLTCIFNTHYPAHALRRADVALMLDGKGNAVFGNCAQVVNEKGILNAFGVAAVIGQFETETKTVHDVIPLDIAGSNTPVIEAPDAPRLAVISIITCDNSCAERINQLLNKYYDLIVGRMGMPYRRLGLNIINITLYGPQADIRALTAQLSIIKGVSAKTIYAESQKED